MKKNKIIIGTMIAIIFILIVGVIFTVYVRRNDTSKPEHTIRSFETALNNDNINGMLDCIEPSEAQIIKDTISKVESITGQSLDGLIDILPFISFVSSSDLFPSYNLEVISTNIDEDESTAIVTIEATPTDKEDSESTLLDVYLIRIEDVWYIRYALPISDGENI